MDRVRMLIIHPNALIRDALLASAQVKAAGIEIVGCYGATCDIMRDRNRRRLRPQVVLCPDVTADYCSGPRCAPIEEFYSKLPILRLGEGFVDLGMKPQIAEAQRVLAALRAHVLSTGSQTLEDKKRDVPLRPASRLTQREMQIVSFLRNNLTNKEIAGELRLSVQTVKNQLHHLFEKLQVKTRRQALRSLLR